MAFVTHTLPTTHPHLHPTHSNLPPFTPPAPPKLLPSRRRHLIQFLHQPNPPSSPSPIPSNSPSNLSQRRAAVVNALLQRRASRQSAIAADAAQKAQAWADTLARLQAPAPTPLPESTSAPQPPLDTPVSHDSTPSSPVAPLVQDLSTEPAVESRHLSDVEHHVEPAGSDLGRAVPDVDASPRSSVADLYAPPATDQGPSAVESGGGVPRPSVDFSVAAEKIRDVIGSAGSAAQLALDKLVDDDKTQDKQDGIVADMFQGIADQIRDEVDMVKNGVTEEEAKTLTDKLGDMWRDNVDKVEGVVEDAVEQAEVVVEKLGETVENVVEATENIVEATVESVKDPTVGKQVEEAGRAPDATGKKTLGEKILNAIVDGVEHAEKPLISAEEDPVDKAYVVELVSTGKIKSLTVTKLRRLLSANSLKTSGRKSELIARLTSFAKAK